MKTSWLMVAAALLIVLAGCGTGSPELDKGQVAKATDAAKIMRETYDKAGGDKSKVSPEDWKRYSDAMGGDKYADYMWEQMKNPTMRGGVSVPTKTGP